MQISFSEDPSDFVSLEETIRDLFLEIRYYSTFNFIGDRIDGYEQPTALLTREAAAALGYLTAEEFDEIIARPNKTPADYKNQMWVIRLGVFLSRLTGSENRNLRV